MHKVRKTMVVFREALEIIFYSIADFLALQVKKHDL